MCFLPGKPTRVAEGVLHLCGMLRFRDHRLRHPRARRGAVVG